MFKLVVLSALLALASAKPSLTYSPLVAPAVYATPALYGSVHSSPILSAYSSSLISAPLVSAYSSPLVSALSTSIVSTIHGSPALALAPNTPAIVTKATGTPLETIEVINARAAHNVAKVLNAHGIHKRSIAYSPLISSPLVSAYSSPILPALISAYSSPLISAHSAPLISYSSPLISAHSTPLISAYSSPLITHASPLVSDNLALAPNTPAIVNKATGVPLDTIEVVNARAAHKIAKVLNAHGIHKRSIAYSPLITAPAVYAAPTAVSHQSRVDVHSSPVVAVSSPVISAPVISTPVISAYSSPILSSYANPLLKSISPVVSSYSSLIVNPHVISNIGIHAL